MDKIEDSKQILSLSKRLIKNLPVFMETAVDSLSSFTGMSAKKISHEICGFESAMNKNSLTAVMRFKGDIKGTFILIFPKDIAIKTVESLIGDSINENDIEGLKDAVGEFCNIVTGSIKTVLSKKDININFELPKAYSSVKITSGHIGDGNGVWVDMELDGNPFYMFIMG